MGYYPIASFHRATWSINTPMENGVACTSSGTGWQDFRCISAQLDSTALEGWTLIKSPCIDYLGHIIYPCIIYIHRNIYPFIYIYMYILYIYIEILQACDKPWYANRICQRVTQCLFARNLRHPASGRWTAETGHPPEIAGADRPARKSLTNASQLGSC